jgi:hypothetical protein
MKRLNPKYFLFVSIIWLMSVEFGYSQNISDSLLVSYDLGEIVVFESYKFKNQKEEKKYKSLEEDLRAIYPIIQIVRDEYSRVSKELEMYYEGDREKKFLKWYENYARESYMHHLKVLNVRQGKLFLKMVSRELSYSPFELIKKYRNGFSAFIWQGTARFFKVNLKLKYVKDEQSMIEHVMRKLDAEYHYFTN